MSSTLFRSLGDYAYIREAFGSLPAFLFLWIALIIVNPTSDAIMALTFANYVLKPVYPNCEIPQLAVRLLAAVVICERVANCVAQKQVLLSSDSPK